MSNLENLVNQTRLATDYAKNKTLLREKIQTDLHFTYNGGLFRADPAQYTFVILWQGDLDALFLEDTYGNPIKIEQKEFVKLSTEHYQRVMNRWHQEHAELKRIRKV
jgi:hypothetical protein